MKTDIDSLMQLSNIDALLVTGSTRHNSPMYYFTGGANLGQADLLKLRGQAPVLFYNSMERDEAARTGLATKSLEDYRFPGLLKQTNGDQVKATILRYQQMFADFGLASGRVGLYGKIDAGAAYAIYAGLQQAMPG